MQQNGKTEVKEKKRTVSYFTVFVAAVLIVVGITSFISICFRIEEKQQIYRELEIKLKQASELNAEYQYLLDEDNQLEYIERIAREKYGYISPGERAFFDSSYGK